jgi:uncharacterized protein YdhG (YjbR/CyaY superfamily)
MDKPNNTDDYIASFPPPVQERLQQVRAAIKKAVPDAEECISYGIPTFRLNGPLVHFAAFQQHIGFYALPSGNEAFQKELSAYKVGKGSIQFPLNKPLPLELITKIVQFRVQENRAKAAQKKKS